MGDFKNYSEYLTEAINTKRLVNIHESFFRNVVLSYHISENEPPVERAMKFMSMNSAALTGLMPIFTLSSLLSITVGVFMDSSQIIL